MPSRDEEHVRAQAKHTLQERYANDPVLLFLEFYVLGEIDAIPPALEHDARRLVPEAFGGEADEWLVTLRGVFQGSTELGEYVRREWSTWKEKRAARGEVANPITYAMLMADERAEAEKRPAGRSSRVKF